MSVWETKFLSRLHETLGLAVALRIGHPEISVDVFFRGSVWDVRRSVGNLAILYREPAELPARFRLSDSEYRELLGRNEVNALIENMRDLHANLLVAFRDMEAAAGTILIELEKQ